MHIFFNLNFCVGGWILTIKLVTTFSFFFSSVTHYYYFCDLRGVYYFWLLFPPSSKPFGRYYIYFFNVYYFLGTELFYYIEQQLVCYVRVLLAAIKLYQNIQSNQLVQQNSRTEQQNLYTTIFFFTISIDFCFTNFILERE